MSSPEAKIRQPLTVKEMCVAGVLICWVGNQLNRGERRFEVMETGGDVADFLMYKLRITDAQLQRIMPAVLRHFTGEGWKINDLEEGTPPKTPYPHNLEFVR